MNIDCRKRNVDIVVLEKMRKLFDEAVISKFSSPAARDSYRKGVHECISILEKEYDLHYS